MAPDGASAAGMAPDGASAAGASAAGASADGAAADGASADRAGPVGLPTGLPDRAPNLQEAVLRLQRFWSAQGCLRLPPCDFAAPFATLHPDAFFRLIGNEPWRVAFVQPVRRPLDGRHGEHPYRLAKHHQLEVVLKPPPKDVQSLYLESLEVLGLDPRLHDVRFAEWTWEPRSLGARGSGWHAVVDGLGVTRLTYLERLADRALDPPAVELSYGLERLLMRLQDVPSAFEVNWSNDGTDYGRLRHRDEAETSRYVCEIADVEALRLRLQSFDREAGRCLEAQLAQPAYEQAVRCLEPLDILEARGDMTARERSSWLEQIRGRVRSAADLYLGRPAAGDSPEPALASPEPVEKPQRKTSRPAARSDGAARSASRKAAAEAAPAKAAPAKAAPARAAPARAAPAKAASAQRAPSRQAPGQQAPREQAPSKQASAKQATAKQATGEQASARKPRRRSRKPPASRRGEAEE